MLEGFDDDELNEELEEDADGADHAVTRNRLLLCYLVYKHMKKRKRKRRHAMRSVKRTRNRRSEQALRQEAIDDNLFRREFRMSPQAFDKLVDLLSDTLSPKESRIRPDSIHPMAKIMMTLRFWLVVATLTNVEFMV